MRGTFSIANPVVFGQRGDRVLRAVRGEETDNDRAGLQPRDGARVRRLYAEQEVGRAEQCLAVGEVAVLERVIRQPGGFARAVLDNHFRF